MVKEQRLIDANALLKELEKFENPVPNKSGYDFLCGVATVITEIEDAPTADTVKVEQHNKLAEENEALRRRLQHLLQSETVRMYDEIDPRTRKYQRDIRQLDTSTAPATKWIPVTERLPEVIDSYLVVVKYKYDFEKAYTIDTDVATYDPCGSGYIDNCWNTYTDWDEGQQYLHVTHWMPLPEPPKEV